MQTSLRFTGRDREIVAIAEGAAWLKRWLSLDEQRDLVAQCRAIMEGPAGGYVPTVRGGGKMHVRMVCLCIMNWYDAEGRMSVHQDRDEGRESVAAGLPVVSLSLGDTARFLFGGVKRRDPVESILLESGDAFVFGGPARLRYHGVSRIIPGTGPRELEIDGRFNLTFRKY
jgi:hypothetical protein